MTEKYKYIRLKTDEIIFFPATLMHSDFKIFNPITAGFCEIDEIEKRIFCFGNSISLGLSSEIEEDSKLATIQMFGMKNYINNHM